MPDTPSRFYLDELRNLQGAPKVTSPFSNPASIKAERVFSQSTLDAPPAYGDPDPDPVRAAAGCRLTVLQVLATDLGKIEYYAVWEALGTRIQQDQWNRRDSYPYALATNPRLTREYRFFFDQVPTFIIGTTTDTVVTAASLITLEEKDESAVIKGFTAIFDDIPSASIQAGVGTTPGGIVALGVSVSYPEDPAFPVLSWAFRALKSAYVAPTAVNAACPIPGYTGLVQTDEKAVPSDDSPEILVVTREYQILPGPIISGTDSARLPRTLTPTPAYYLNGDLLTTTHQKLVYGAQADEDSSTILSSKIEATSKWYVIKTNITRANPALPLVTAPAFVEGEDGTQYRMEIVVARNDDVTAQATALNAAVVSALSLIKGNYTVLDYKTNPLAPNEVEIVYTQVSGFTLKTGQEWDGKLNLAVTYTEQIVSKATADALIGSPNTTIKPLSKNLSLVRIETQDTSVLDAYIASFPTNIPRLNLPDILVALVADVDISGADGAAAENGSASETGNGSINLNITQSAQGSRGVQIDVSPLIQSVYADNIVATDYVIFTPDGANTANVLMRLGTHLGQTVHPWLLFQPMLHSIQCTSQKVSVRAGASARLSVAFGQNGNSDGLSEGYSKDVDVSSTKRTTTIKPTIHGNLSVSGVVSTFATAGASATAKIGGYTFSNAALARTAYAYVNPYQFSATPGVSQIPTSGLYAYRVNSEGYRNGYTMVRVQVVDFSMIAVGTATPDTHQVLTLQADSDTATGSYLEADNAKPASDLNPTAAPTITTQPASQVVQGGQTVTLFAKATGAAPFTYQWYHGTTAIAGATGSTLILSAFNPSTDAGSYYVTITNANGPATSSTATLGTTPTTGPTITTQPVSQTGSTGGSVTFSVVANGVSGTTLTYQWYRGGGAIDGATSSSYEIDGLTSDSAATYYVVVSDGTNTTQSSNAVLTVVPAPVVTVNPANGTINSSGAIALTATVVAATANYSMFALSGALRYYGWYQNGIEVSASAPDYACTINGNGTTTIATTLIVGHDFVDPTANRTASTPASQTVLYFKATDYYGNTVTTASATVTIGGTADNPTITAQPAVLVGIYNSRGGYTPPGGSYVFSVSATSDGDLIYRWYEGTTNLGNVTPSGRTPSLSANGTSDRGPFACRVYAEGGETTSSSASIKSYWLEFNTPDPTMTTTASSTGSSVPVQMNFYYVNAGGVAPDEPFTITLSQICTDGTTAHGSFSVSSFSSVTHTSGLNYLTGISNYTASATDAGKSVKIIATLAFSAGPVTGTIGNISTIVQITS